MYGPIMDVERERYYFNLCQVPTEGSVCERLKDEDVREPFYSHVCQVTNYFGAAVDGGNVSSYIPFSGKIIFFFHFSFFLF
jgi:hypothetical protein